MDARAQGGDLDAFLAPLMGADDALQFAQRGHERRVIVAIGFAAGLPHVGRAPQRNAVIGVEGQQQHVEDAGALRLRLAMQMEGFGRAGGGFCGLAGLAGLAAVLAIGPARQRLQQLPRILEVAAPQDGRAFARQPVSRIGRQGIVAGHHAPGRRGAAFGAPERAAGFARLAPANLRRLAGACCFRNEWSGWHDREGNAKSAFNHRTAGGRGADVCALLRPGNISWPLSNF